VTCPDRVKPTRTGGQHAQSRSLNVTSLDGFIAGPERDLDWMISRDPQREVEHLQFLDSVDTILIGHGVYHRHGRLLADRNGRAR
jgi:hypothetical protein